MSSRFGNSLNPEIENSALLKSSTRFGASRGGINSFTGRKKQKTAQEVLEEIKDKALETFDPEKIPPTYMYISISGLIQSGTVITIYIP